MKIATINIIMGRTVKKEEVGTKPVPLGGTVL